MNKNIEELILKLQKSTHSALLDIQLKNVPIIHELKTESVQSIRTGLEGESIEEKMDNLWLINNPSPFLVTRYTDSYFRGSIDLLEQQGKVSMPIFVNDAGIMGRPSQQCTNIIYTERSVYMQHKLGNPTHAIVKNGGFVWDNAGITNDCFMMIRSDGKYTTNTAEAAQCIKLKDNEKDKYVILKGTVDTNGYIHPSIDNKHKLFKCNFTIIVDGKPLLNPSLTEHGYNVFKLDNFESSKTYQYICCYYKTDKKLYDNLLNIENSLEIINSITNNNELYQNFISRLEGDFDFRFNPKLSYKENLDNALNYILNYNKSLLDELFDKESNTYSVTYTGKDFKQLAVDGTIRMSRRIPDGSYDGYNNSVMIYVNGDLYPHHDKIEYTGISAKIPVIGILDSDSVEVTYYKRVENAINTIKVTDKDHLLKGVFDEADDNLFFTENTYGHHLFEHHNNVKPVYRRARYVRNSTTGNSNNQYTHLTDLKVITPEGIDVAFGKCKQSPEVTDGNLTTYLNGAERVTIDLLGVFNIDYISVLHYYVPSSPRTYYNHKLEISENGTEWFVVHDASIHGDRCEVPEGNKYIVEPEWVVAEQKDVVYEIPHEKVKYTSPVRYIRNWLNGNTINTSSHWNEIMAFSNDINVALNKPTTFTPGYVYDSNIKVTDGVITSFAGIHTAGNVYTQIDLGDIYDISYIKMWHYYGDNRKYHGNVLQTSIDGETWVTHFDSTVDGEYLETDQGKTVFLQPIPNNLFKVNFLNEDRRNRNYGENYNGLKSIMCRYVKHVLRTSDVLNKYASWAEIEVISKNVNIAAGKAVTFKDDSNPDYVTKQLPQLTNGNKLDGVWIDENLKRPCIVLDLVDTYDIDAINLYHLSPFNISYQTSELYVSKDGITWTKLYDVNDNDGEYISYQNGNVIEFDKTNYIATQYYNKYLDIVSKRQFRHHKGILNHTDTIDRYIDYGSLILSKYSLPTGFQVGSKDKLLSVFTINNFKPNSISKVYGSTTIPMVANEAIKLEGKICIQKSGIYNFNVVVDESFYIKIGNQEKFLSWNNNEYQTFDIELQEGLHDLLIYEGNNVGGGRVGIKWKFNTDSLYTDFNTNICQSYKLGLNLDIYSKADTNQTSIKEMIKWYNPESTSPFKYINIGYGTVTTPLTDRSMTPTPIISKATSFIAKYHGLINVPVSGMYKFSLYVDDEAELYIDDILVAKHSNSSNTVTGFSDATACKIVDVQLQKGHHKFTLFHRNTNTDYKLALGWMIPGKQSFESISLERFIPAKYDVLPMVKLPKEFKYCQDKSQYLVFYNGRRLSTKQYSIKTPDLDTVYDASYVIINKDGEFMDTIDVFYTPEKQIEIFKRDSLDTTDNVVYSGYIDLGENTLGYRFNPQYATLFVNGKKVAVSDIHEITDNAVRLKKNIETVHNLVVIKNNSFSNTLVDLVKNSDIWNTVIKDSPLRDLVTSSVNITNKETSIDEPKYEDESYLTWNLIYNFWIKRFNLIDPSKRFTYNEDQSVLVDVVPINLNSVYEVVALATNGTYEHIEYTEPGGDIVTGFKAVSSGTPPAITIAVGNWSVSSAQKYYSLSLKLFANFDLYGYETRPYIRLLDANDTVINNKYTYLKYQNNDNPPIGHWITMYAEGITVSSMVSKLQICVDLVEDGQVVELKDVFLEIGNKYSSTNLKIIPIDATIVTGHKLPYNII